MEKIIDNLDLARMHEMQEEKDYKAFCEADRKDRYMKVEATIFIKYDNATLEEVAEEIGLDLWEIQKKLNKHAIEIEYGDIEEE